MPNLMTHKIFGEDVLKVANSEILAIVKASPQAFSVGTSGPDFLFYHSKLPWQNQELGSKVRNIGSLIHQEKIDDWFKVAISACLNEKDLKIKNDMQSYMIGHLTHWALDKSVHPFIFYRSDGTSQATKYWHYRYESMLDTIMVNKYRKTSIKDYKSRAIMQAGNDVQIAIYNIYKPAVEKVFDIDFKFDYVEQSFKDCDKILMFMYDVKGYKFKMISLLERIIGQSLNFSSHIVTNNVDDRFDILNLNNHQWKNPADASFVSNESFLDLYFKAIRLASDTLLEFSQVIAGKPIDDLMKIINNQSYETGLSKFKEMKSFKSIY